MLNNALFLLQMINTSPEGQLLRETDEPRFSPIIPLENHFSCYGALGVTDSQIEKEEEQCGEAVPNQLNFLQMDDMTVEERQALDNILSSPIILGDLEEPMFAFKHAVGPRRRKTSNGDHGLGNTPRYAQTGPVVRNTYASLC